MQSCAETAIDGQRSFQSQYNTARTALEKGNFDKASKIYARLLPQSGSLGNRIRLEYAHSMLRAGEFVAAVELADAVASQETGGGRQAALSVKGTAEHEVGLKFLRQGETAKGAAHLQAAQSALDEVLREHPKLDPLGSLAGRRASIDVQLKSLR